MKTLKIVLMLVVAVALAAVVLQNRALLQVQFLWWTRAISAIVLLLLTVVGGFILGLLTALLVKSGRNQTPYTKDMSDKELYRQKKQAELDEYDYYGRPHYWETKKQKASAS